MKSWFVKEGVTNKSEITKTDEEHNNVLRNEGNIFQSSKDHLH